MSAHRPRRISRDAAEHLLRGAQAGAPGGPDALARLLATAASPAHAGELAGEQATMAAFRAARLHAVQHTRRRSMLKSAVAKMLTVKAAAAAVAVSAVGGGVALAASNGVLPSSLGAGNSQAAAHASARPSAGAGKGDHGSAAPSPSMVGLCRAYAAGVHDNPGKALENPAFGALISAAGGKEKVTDFCTGILKDAPGGGSSDKGSAPSDKGSAASDKGSSKASDRPTAHATPSHPTGSEETSHPQPDSTSPSAG